MKLEVLKNKLGRPLLTEVAATFIESGLPVLDPELTGVSGGIS